MATFSNGYTIGFSAAICIVCSVAVSSAAMALHDRQETNERRDLQESILGALGIPAGGDPCASGVDCDPGAECQPVDDAVEDGEKECVVTRRLQGDEIDRLYAERVKVIVVDAEGNILEDKTLDDALAEADAAKSDGREPEFMAVYLRSDGDRIGAYALPLSGKGLWGPISGFLAIAPDGVTVSGSTFFAPKETPGLGYEITAAWWEADWVDKKVADDGGRTRTIAVVKGDPELKCSSAPEHCVNGVSGATITSRGVDAMVEEALDRYDPYLKRVRSGAGGGR